MMLSLALFAQLAATCAPGVHVDTLAAIARTESGFHVGAINDNTAKRSYFPKTMQEAVAIASELVAVKKHAVDLGLMQISSSNLGALGLTPSEVLDPCRNLQAGARVLASGYRPPAAGADPQPALMQALSRYNTGSPSRGFENGYVDKVVASEGHVVPAIRLNAAGAGQGAPAAAAWQRLEPVPPPVWDVFGQARYARSSPARPQSATRASEAQAPGPAQRRCRSAPTVCRQ